MTEYKVGDKVRILKGVGFCTENGIPYKVGEIHIIAGVDADGDPWFDGDGRNVGWANFDNWFEKVEV